MIKDGWLDEKHGKFRNRVYMLIFLFISNALIPIGSILHFLYKKSFTILGIGLLGTIICIIILSEPVNLDNIKE